MTELTLNIPAHRYRQLSEAACRCNVSVADVLVALVRRLRPAKTPRLNLGKRIRYQADNPDGWDVVHVPVPDELYEKCLDLRRFLKCSVSLLVVEEFARCLHLVLQDLICWGRRYSCGNRFRIISSVSSECFKYTVIHEQNRQSTG